MRPTEDLANRRLTPEEKYIDAMKGLEKRPALRSALVGVAVALWLSMVAIGSASIMLWEFKAGPRGVAEPKKGRGFEAIMVAHPDCPCTIASLHALRDLVVKEDGKLRASVYFVGRDDGRSTRTERAAADIPDVVVRWISPRDAIRYGAITSGHVTLYRGGAPIFEGGLSASRAVEGPSAGRVAIDAAVNGEAFSRWSPVFGCPLNPKERP